jgi:hypothetical protein
MPLLDHNSGISPSDFVSRGLAQRLNIDLGQAAVAVVPVGGVDFASIGRLFGAAKIAAPLAIVTDADPLVENEDKPWREHLPKKDPTTGKPQRSDRAAGVHAAFGKTTGVVVEISELTLEYDLALAGLDNALCMFDAWSSCYTKQPTSLKRAELEKLTTAEERALLFWRTICRGSPQHGKAELAQALALTLEEKTGLAATFAVPPYLERAIRHAARAKTS